MLTIKLHSPRSQCRNHVAPPLMNPKFPKQSWIDSSPLYPFPKPSLISHSKHVPFIHLPHKKIFPHLIIILPSKCPFLIPPWILSNNKIIHSPHHHHHHHQHTQTQLFQAPKSYHYVTKLHFFFHWTCEIYPTALLLSCVLRRCVTTWMDKVLYVHPHPILLVTLKNLSTSLYGACHKI